MTDKPTIRAQYGFLILPALDGGLSSIQDWERAALAVLYVKEVRKGAFRYHGVDDDDHLRTFLAHVRAQFVESDDIKLVLDFQPRLLATADDLSHRAHPIESVLLYATWCEHWLNATLISAALGRGLSESDATQMVRDSSIHAKVGWLWRAFSLPDIPDRLRLPVTFLAEVRNEHVHYKWKGHDPDTLTDDASRLKLAIADIRSVIEGLVDFEIVRIVAEHIATADRLFRTSIAPLWRDSALQRPQSAPRLVEKP
jgi:hypothetical protein